jgi:hypothetical protein
MARSIKKKLNGSTKWRTRMALIAYLRRLLAFSANITFFASRRFLVLWECDTCRLSPEFLFAIGIFA